MQPPHSHYRRHARPQQRRRSAAQVPASPSSSRSPAHHLCSAAAFSAHDIIALEGAASSNVPFIQLQPITARHRRVSPALCRHVRPVERQGPARRHGRPCTPANGTQLHPITCSIAAPTLLPVTPLLQFRLRIACGKHPRDVEVGGEIAALQAQATLTLRQAAARPFNRIMVSCASVVPRSHATLRVTRCRWVARRWVYRASSRAQSACAYPWPRCSPCSCAHSFSLAPTSAGLREFECCCCRSGGHVGLVGRINRLSAPSFRQLVARVCIILAAAQRPQHWHTDGRNIFIQQDSQRRECGYTRRRGGGRTRGGLLSFKSHIISTRSELSLKTPRQRASDACIAPAEGFECSREHVQCDGV
jgi:hypothetical protein